MAKETRERLESRFPDDLIRLVLDMYDGRKKSKEIVKSVKLVFPDHPFTYRDIPRILKVYRGEVLDGDKAKGKTYVVTLDADVAQFIDKLPISPSDFINSIMGIYVREYNYKKSQQSE